MMSGFLVPGQKRTFSLSICYGLISHKPQIVTCRMFAGLCKGRTRFCMCTYLLAALLSGTNQ